MELKTPDDEFGSLERSLFQRNRDSSPGAGFITSPFPETQAFPRFFQKGGKPWETSRRLRNPCSPPFLVADPRLSSLFPLWIIALRWECERKGIRVFTTLPQTVVV